MATTTIFRYPLHDTSGIKKRDLALKHLRNQEIWRTALPLYRRLRFGRFENSHLFTSLDLRAGETPPEDWPWFYAFVDRSCRPETEVWFFGSWEAEPERDDSSDVVEAFTVQRRPREVRSEQYDSQDSYADPVTEGMRNGGRSREVDSERCESDDNTRSPGATEPWETSQARTAQESLVRGLMRAIRSLEVPTSIHQDLLEAKATELQLQKDGGGLDRDDYAAHILNPDVMLWGAVHERTVPILQRLGYLAVGFEATLVPNDTFIFDVERLPPLKDLPEGLVWGTMKHKHFPLVKSRTEIPRQDRTMAILPSLAIYPADSDTPISWAFVGLDSSLTTLHVEPEWRGRGLAKTLTTKLLREKMGRFYEEGQERLGIGYVMKGNEASRRMCESLAARSDWEVYWLRVDLAKLETGPQTNGDSSRVHKRKRSSGVGAPDGRGKQAKVMVGEQTIATNGSQEAQLGGFHHVSEQHEPEQHRRLNALQDAEDIPKAEEDGCIGEEELQSSSLVYPPEPPPG